MSPDSRSRSRRFELCENVWFQSLISFANMHVNQKTDGKLWYSKTSCSCIIPIFLYGWEYWAVTKRGEMYSRLMPSINGVLKAVRNQMVPPFAKQQDETDNWATTPFGYCPSSKPGVSLAVQPHCINAIQNRCQEDLNQLPLWRTGGDHQDALVLLGWRLSSKTWNPITSPWMKQLTWLRIVHSGDMVRHCMRSIMNDDAQSAAIAVYRRYFDTWRAVRRGRIVTLLLKRWSVRWTWFRRPLSPTAACRRRALSDTAATTRPQRHRRRWQSTPLTRALVCHSCRPQHSEPSKTSRFSTFYILV